MIFKLYKGLKASRARDAFLIKKWWMEKEGT